MRNSWEGNLVYKKPSNNTGVLLIEDIVTHPSYVTSVQKQSNPVNTDTDRAKHNVHINRVSDVQVEFIENV